MSFYELAYQKCKKLFETLKSVKEDDSGAAANPDDANKSTESPRSRISVKTPSKS